MSFNRLTFVLPIIVGLLPAHLLSHDVYNVKTTYSAAGDCSSDDTTEIQSAIDAAQNSTYGGTVFFPPGCYAISGTLTMGNGSAGTENTKKPVVLQGVSSGIDQTRTGATIIKWTGSAPISTTYMLHVKGPYLGGGINDITLDANDKANLRGVHLEHVAKLRSHSLSIIKYKLGMLLNVTAASGAPYGACDNYFSALTMDSYSSGGSGLHLDGYDANGGADACSNVFVGAMLQHDGATAGTFGLKLGYADNNRFYSTNIYSFGGSNGCGIEFAKATVNSGFPTENYFYGVSPHKGWCGNPGTGVANIFWPFNKGDCSVNCSTTTYPAQGTPPVFFESDGRTMTNVGEIRMRSGSGTAVWLEGTDLNNTSLIKFERGGPSGNGVKFSGFDEFVFNNSGGIGVSALRASTSNQLCYNTGALTGYNALSTCSSLKKFKSGIVPLIGGLDIAAKLRPVTYVSRTSGRPEIGLIAEDVQAVESRLATYDGKGDLVGVDYGHVSAVAIQALQELRQRIESLERQLQSSSSSGATTVSGDTHK